MIDLYPGDYFYKDLAGITSKREYRRGDEHLIEAFLSELVANEDAQWSLTKLKTEHYSPHFSVRGVVLFQRRGFNVYRLRPFFKGLSKYRVLYAYDGQQEEIYLLAVVVKKPEDQQIQVDLSGEYYYDYEPNHWITKRVMAEYEQLGLPKIN